MFSFYEPIETTLKRVETIAVASIVYHWRQQPRQRQQEILALIRDRSFENLRSIYQCPNHILEDYIFTALGGDASSRIFESAQILNAKSTEEQELLLKSPEWLHHVEEITKKGFSQLVPHQKRDLDAEFFEIAFAMQGNVPANVDASAKKQNEESQAPSQADLNLAHECLKIGADHEIAKAQFELGFSYLTGRGVETNKQIASMWFEKGAQNGSFEAMVTLAKSFFLHNPRQKSEYLEKAAEILVKEHAGKFQLLKSNYNNDSLTSIQLDSLGDLLPHFASPIDILINIENQNSISELNSLHIFLGQLLTQVENGLAVRIDTLTVDFFHARERNPLLISLIDRVIHHGIPRYGLNIWGISNELRPFDSLRTLMSLTLNESVLLGTHFSEALKSAAALSLTSLNLQGCFNAQILNALETHPQLQFLNLTFEEKGSEILSVCSYLVRNRTCKKLWINIKDSDFVSLAEFAKALIENGAVSSSSAHTKISSSQLEAGGLRSLRLTGTFSNNALRELSRGLISCPKIEDLSINNYNDPISLICLEEFLQMPSLALLKLNTIEGFSKEALERLSHHSTLTDLTIHNLAAPRVPLFLSVNRSLRSLNLLTLKLMRAGSFQIDPCVLTTNPTLTSLETYNNRKDPRVEAILKVNWRNETRWAYLSAAIRAIYANQRNALCMSIIPMLPEIESYRGAPYFYKYVPEKMSSLIGSLWFNRQIQAQM